MNKDIIIFINAIRPATFEALNTYVNHTGRKFKPVVLVDQTIKDSIFERNGQNNLSEDVSVLVVDLNSAASVRKKLEPYMDRIFAVTSQYENCIQELRQLLPFIPYMPTPTETSLVWATEKIHMRKMMEAYSKFLVPTYKEIFDIKPTTVNEIESLLSYPMVVKPSGLEGSLLVSHINNRHELEDALKRVFLQMQDSYDTWIKRQKPAVLVEEFMIGDMYTVDVYINQQGECHYTPLIKTIVARNAGFDDLFPYKECLPSGLDGEEEKKGQFAAQTACKALGLRSVTAHVEMMLTAEGWKIIELGPRIGGWRQELLQEAYDMNHIMNDIIVRAGEEPNIPVRLQKYVAKYNIYAHAEGILEATDALEKIKSFSSFAYIRQNVFAGEKVLFAKNGGDPVATVVLAHTEKEQLDTDCDALTTISVFDVSPLNSALNLG